MSFIEFSHLPTNKVTHVLIDERTYDKTFYILEQFDIIPITVHKSQDVDISICSHPDIFYFPFKGNIIIAAPNSPEKTTNKLKEIGINIIFGDKVLKSKYPDDSAYNIARISDYIVHNVNITDKIIIKLLNENNLKTINVNQGYTKCSILIIEKNAIITSDKGIAKKAIKYGIDTLLIRPGYIDLFYKNYGFIGGCAGYIDKDLLLFNGDITKHPDYIEIINFLKKYNKNYINIPNMNLLDIGSIIPILQK